jgi:hypothetical protein
VFIATVGVNPTAGEFRSNRDWSAIKSEAGLLGSQKNYFRQANPPHEWFEPWHIGLKFLRVSYARGTATHIDVSYRPVTAMLRDDRTDPVEFRTMVE